MAVLFLNLLFDTVRLTALAATLVVKLSLNNHQQPTSQHTNCDTQSLQT